MTDPNRLRDQADLPPQLEAALRALGQNSTPPEVVERVQRSLAGLPSAGAASGVGFGWGGAVSAVAVVVAVTATVAWTRVQRDEARAVPAASTVSHAEQVGVVEPESEAEPAVASAVAATGASSAAMSSVQPGGSTTIVALAPVAKSRAVPPRASSPRVAASPERNVRSRATSSGVETSVIAEEPRAALARPESAQVTPTEQLTPVVAEPAEAAAKPEEANDAAPRSAIPQPPVPEDEASLVYRAKRLARNDVAAAWTLIESHAQHFPNGTLVEEREVLAIDVLHRMGHDREAKERAARFIAHFPKSGYRSVVMRSAANPQ